MDFEGIKTLYEISIYKYNSFARTALKGSNRKFHHSLLHSPLCSIIGKLNRADMLQEHYFATLILQRIDCFSVSTKKRTSSKE